MWHPQMIFVLGGWFIYNSACENLVGFSTAQPDLFKRHQLLPVRDLKLLVRDYTVSSQLQLSIGWYLYITYWSTTSIIVEQPIAKNALTMLVNLSIDQEVLTNLAQDDVFLETLFNKMMVNELRYLPPRVLIVLIRMPVVRMSRSQMPMKFQCYWQISPSPMSWRNWSP